MTKKFWNDWQKRLGETKNIVIKNAYYGTHRLLYPGYDELVDATFERNYVSITINSIRVNFKRQTHIEHKTYKFHRTEIVTVLFNRYY
jgi:hypothetical protein